MSITGSPLRRVLVTGGAGDIGRGFAAHAAGRYDFTVLDLPEALERAHDLAAAKVAADLNDLPALVRAFAGQDTIVHLAAFRKASTPWRDVLRTNIVGTYNVVAAAISAGCRRVVFASSVHAVSGYREGRQIRESDPPLPGDLYGVGKVFGEALGAYAAAAEGLSFVALRIGAFQPQDIVTDTDSGWLLEEYCAPEDLFQLMQLVIDEDDIGFEIYNAASANRYARLDVSKARRELGYRPGYDSFAMRADIADALATAGPPAPQPESGMRFDLVTVSGDDPAE